MSAAQARFLRVPLADGDCLDAPIARVTAPDIPAIPASPPLEKFYMPSVEKILAVLERTLDYY